MKSNVFFFFSYFVIVASLHVAHAFLITPSISSSFLVALCSTLQAALETLTLLILGIGISQKFPRLFHFYLLLPLSLLLIHLIDFPLERLMNMSFWHALHLVSQESAANFVQLLTAANISWSIWVMGFISFGLFIALGFVFYKITHSYSRSLPSFALSSGAICLLAALLVVDHKINQTLSDTKLVRAHATLPWKTTFFFEPHPFLTLASPLQPLASQEERLHTLDSRTFALLQKPDIYIVIAESLRSDFINQINTPNLHHFKQRNISFPTTFSNANGTHLSWFSLFHSQFPFRWKDPQEQTPFQGSLPLALLKKMGYEIHVSSSSKLSFYQMNQIIFGQEERLANSLFSPGEEVKEPYVRDEMAVNRLIEKMQEPGSARVFILFLDATHFDYSFPEKMGRFTPYSSGVSYLTTLFSKKAPAPLINRYQNALSFVDAQFGKLLRAISHTEGGREAVIAFTGDHGEEFYEQGNLFHASMLTKEQITPPLFYRFGNNKNLKKAISCKSTCHMDIFPSIFHYLTGEDVMASVLEGQSIFKEERWPFTVIARFNGSRPPLQYCIHGDNAKLLVAFENPEIIQAKKILILSTKTFEDDTIPPNLSSLDEEFGSALERLFSP